MDIKGLCVAMAAQARQCFGPTRRSVLEINTVRRCPGVVGFLFAILFAPSIVYAQEWLLSGSWSQGKWHEHDVISSKGEGTAQLNPNSPPRTAFGTNSINFGLSLRSGQLDLIFRKTDRGYYRLLFLTSGPSIRLEQVLPDLTAISHAESVIAGLKPDIWYNINVSQSVASDDEPAVLHVTCEIDGKRVLTSSIPSPLPVGEISFASYPNTSVSIDVVDDIIDQRALQFQMEQYARGRRDNGQFIALNRDTFAQQYASLGRQPALVQMREQSPYGHVIEYADLKEHGYVLPDVITGYLLSDIMAVPSAPVVPYDLNAPNFTAPSISFAPAARRPIIYAVTPYELNALNDPADSVFDIYGTNLGSDGALVFLGNPTHEGTPKKLFGIKVLKGEEARRAVGNDEGLARIQKIHVDLRRFYQDLRHLHLEAEVPIWIYPDYKGPNFSNPAQIFLKSRWPAETMFVSYTTRFRIRDDNAGGLDGLPEEYWALSGSTIDRKTGEDRVTTVHFPFEMWSRWSAGKNDWLAQVPLFAAKITDMSQLVRLGVTGFESDAGGGGTVVKVMDALGKGLQKIKTTNPVADTVMGATGGILEGIAGFLTPSDDTFGVLALRFLETDNFGEFSSHGLREMAIGGDVKALADVAIKRVEAPYLQSATVRVKRFRWTKEPFDPNPPSTPWVRDNNMYVVARAATSFDGNMLGRSGEAGLHTDYQLTKNENEWVELSDKGNVLQERFDPPQPRPFLYLEFAVWDHDETNDDDNFGGPIAIMRFFDEPIMDPHEQSIKNSDKLRLYSYDEGISCEIEYEYEIVKAIALTPSP